MIATAGPLPRRGEMIDVGGRRMRIVCMGPKESAKPVILLEAGAFGFAADFGTVKGVGQVLFTNFLLPFEATSLLLLVAIVGAVVVAKERI